jgi:Ca2+/Na+ antiporter
MFSTKQQSAIEGSDFIAKQGKLEFAHGETKKSIEIEIVQSDVYEADETFQVVLSDSTGGAKFNDKTDGDENQEIATVLIKSSGEKKSLLTLLGINEDKFKLGNASYLEQIKEAISLPGPDDENVEGEDPSAVDYIIHVIMLPWKLLFAIVPPPLFAGGWACFIVSLGLVGVVTAGIGDLAGMFGCVIGMDDALTAITFVALGTSLPDTFASLAAAQGDSNADASIGNVTGSNSVNVFLGLGLPWLLAAIYWSGGEASAEWTTYLNSITSLSAAEKLAIATNHPGGFIVPAGSLAFSVIVFSVCACICLATIVLRRFKGLGELGGPKGAKYATGALFVLLWFAYVTLSALKIYGQI